MILPFSLLPHQHRLLFFQTCSSCVQEGALDNEVALLRCLAALLRHLPPHALDPCQDLAQLVAAKIIGAYLELWPKQRPPVHAVLLLLLQSAAAHEAGVLAGVVQQVVGVLLVHTVKPLPPEEVRREMRRCAGASFYEEGGVSRT